MINDQAVSEAIKQHIATGGLAGPLFYPNEDIPITAPIPRLEVNLDRNTETDNSLAGGSPVAQGFIRVMAYSTKGVSTGAAETVAGAVKALFPKALRIAFAGGNIVLTDTASIRAGFRDGPAWIIPIIAPYRAEKLRA